MHKILLDSSFIISAVKNKIDIFDVLENYSEILIPTKVIGEVFNISKSRQSAKTRTAAELALKILELYKKKFTEINLGEGHTDTQIINYAEYHPEVLVATLDKEIKAKLKGRTILIRKGKKIELF